MAQAGINPVAWEESKRLGLSTTSVVRCWTSFVFWLLPHPPRSKPSRPVQQIRQREQTSLTLSSHLWVPLSHRLMLHCTLPLLSRSSSSIFLRFSGDPIGLGSALTSNSPSTQTSSSLFAIPRIAWPALSGRRSPLSDRASSSTLGGLFSRFSVPRLPPMDSSSVILHSKFTIRSTSL